MHIHAILCARSSQCDWIDLCHHVTSIASCMRHVSTCFNTLEGFSLSRCEHVDTPYIHRRKTLLVCHSTSNAKPCQIFVVENGVSLLLYSHIESKVRIAFGVLWHIWGKVLSDFHHENKAKCCRIFAMEIWQWLQTHLESINQDHTCSEFKPQSPTHLNPRKLMLIVCVQLPMSKNYDFNKTKDCLRIGIVGCLRLPYT